MERDVILASASARRKELLTQIGVPFRVIVSEKEEKICTDSPEAACRMLAAQKAEAVFSAVRPDIRKETVVIGADTVVWAGGRILGKPADHEDAAKMLRLISGTTHQVYTGVCVIRQGTGKGEPDVRIFSEETEVTVAPLSETDIAWYIGTGEPADKAGAYGIQGLFARYIAGIHGDYNNVVGLPVGRLWRECLSQ